MFCGDIAPALICLNGSAILKNKEGERTLPLDDLYTGNGGEPLDIQSGEFLSHVALPENPLTEGVYLKLTMRQTGGFPIVGLAAAIQRSDGICRKSRIAVTSIEPRPIRLKKVERLLEGKELKRPLLEEVTKIASEEVHPFTAMGIGAAYRRRMVGVMMRKALETLS
jgi:CO/xanthine dehydrogenase FAD-binding subunit